ncbi:DUF6204 family protein [Rugosimonospora acidiphila]|uniref:DUF6204 family protein n=1 Tax=Rugosimonospora acidiphila TaxID=556531 RepID=UPI0031E93820
MTIQGTFGDLSAAGRASLLAGVDVLQAAYTPAGTFTCDRSISAFTFRCQVPADPTDGEHEAVQRAVAVLEAHGHPYRILRVAATDLREVKIRRKGGSGGPANH